MARNNRLSSSSSTKRFGPSSMSALSPLDSASLRCFPAKLSGPLPAGTADRSWRPAAASRTRPAPSYTKEAILRFESPDQGVDECYGGFIHTHDVRLLAAVPWARDACGTLLVKYDLRLADHSGLVGYLWSCFGVPGLAASIERVEIHVGSPWGFWNSWLTEKRYRAGREHGQLPAARVPGLAAGTAAAEDGDRKRRHLSRSAGGFLPARVSEGRQERLRGCGPRTKSSRCQRQNRIVIWHSDVEGGDGCRDMGRLEPFQLQVPGQ
ncbi:hypothetical protein BKA67DRAFT_541644 [Truncatella angustata]|uniref:Uncharacterized protein n=1 Tax=Truncatella angustata TaxID=152316 RepID=A0A9P8RJW4_9PEZI|nr:uncharacterized protein BKA67DRAFT_541644 [Truncatella angustata]KAH6645421.1 hypothetical protein BKA67DRAFT_541644 [Truncatella angustata]